MLPAGHLRLSVPRVVQQLPSGAWVAFSDNQWAVQPIDFTGLAVTVYFYTILPATLNATFCFKYARWSSLVRIQPLDFVVYIHSHDCFLSFFRRARCASKRSSALRISLRR